eukprot:scaffold6653_cov105-Phaeocystis_antarctica.AAC.5
MPRTARTTGSKTAGRRASSGEGFWVAQVCKKVRFVIRSFWAPADRPPTPRVASRASALWLPFSRHCRPRASASELLPTPTLILTLTPVLAIYTSNPNPRPRPSNSGPRPQSYPWP